MEIDEDLIAEAQKAWEQRSWTIEHVLFPALKLFLKPSRQMATDGTVIQVKAMLEDYIYVVCICSMFW